MKPKLNFGDFVLMGFILTITIITIITHYN